MCPVLHKLRDDGICRDGAQAKGAPRPASEFVDGAPRLATKVRDVKLKCEKAMELTVSSHRFCFFCCSRKSRDEAALSESVPTVARMKRCDRGSRTLCASTAHSSCDVHVGYMVWPQRAGADVSPVRGETGCSLWVIQ